MLEFNGAALSVDISESTPKTDIVAAGDELVPMFKAVVDNAPTDLASTAEELNKTIAPLKDGDATAFNADSTFESYGKLLEGATSACDYPTTNVKARDYAFDAPDTISAGDVAFSFTNTSDAEDHEMVILAKATGVDLSWDELLALPQEEAQTKTEFKTITVAPAGMTSTTIANLTPGSYVMVCFMPVGGKEAGPPHFTQGMVHEFSVD